MLAVFVTVAKAYFGVLIMGIFKHSFLAGVTALLLLGTSIAAQAQGTGIYLGASWGAYSINESNLSDNDHVLKFVLGNQLLPLIGVEGSWADFNRVNNGSNNFSADGIGLAAVLSIPVLTSSSIFFKGGQFWWNSDSVLGSVLGVSSGNDPFWGAGFKYGFNDNFSLRLEAERYDVASTHLNTVTAGVEFMF